MKTAGYVSLAVLLVIVSFAIGSRWGHGSSPAGGQQQKVLYYACPMHPQYRSNHPGDCPSCGMRLEPVYTDGATPGGAASGASIPKGAIRVSTERQQAIGVKLATAERLAGTRNLRTTGRVAANENATYPLVSGVDARVREVRSPTAGTLVRKDELLATLYAPELLNAAQAYLLALNGFERLGAAAPESAQAVAARTTLERAEEGLRNLGVSEGQITELRTKRQTSPNVTIASPVDGFIVERNVLVGQSVERGRELYRIADLRRVWILADVYENQLQFVTPGVSAHIIAGRQNREYSAKVSTAQPIFDETTRTMKVRLEMDNPGFALKPGMFVDVDFAIELPPTLAVPADAIVDSGVRKTLFVDRGNGYFEPRAVETGWRIGDQVEITRGLMAGDRIVIAGTFLMDSESRMRAAAAGSVAESVTDVVCGMDVDPKKATAAGKTVLHDGKTYYFCSDECKQKFEKEPGKYIK
jgi:membrane fusion protein, copper/silver efflux system